MFFSLREMGICKALMPTSSMDRTILPAFSSHIPLMGEWSNKRERAEIGDSSGAGQWR